MIKVERANVVLTVPESMLDYYVSKGYTARSQTGEIIKEAIPTDLGALRKAFVEHTAEIKSLKSTIARIEAQLAEKSADIKSDDLTPKTRKPRAKKTDEE